MAPSRYDWKIVDWDVKPQHNQPTNPHCKPELKETTSWTRVGQAKDIASSPNPLVKVLCRGRHWVWGPTVLRN